MRTCSLCDKKYCAKGLCKNCYSRSPEQVAYRKAYRQRPDIQTRDREYKKIYNKTYYENNKTKCKQNMKAYAKNPKRLSYLETWKASLGGKEYVRAYDKALYSNPEKKEKKKAQVRAHLKTPQGRIVDHKHSAKRRSLGHEVINPELVGEPGFHGHHIDRTHVLYIPTELHASVRHSQKNPESMARINTVAFAWLIGARLIGVSAH